MSGCRSRWNRRKKVSGGGDVVLSEIHERHLVGWLSAWCGGDECACLECDGDGGDDGIGGAALATGSGGCWEWRIGDGLWVCWWW